MFERVSKELNNEHFLNDFAYSKKNAGILHCRDLRRSLQRGKLQGKLIARKKSKGKISRV